MICKPFVLTVLLTAMAGMLAPTMSAYAGAINTPVSASNSVQSWTSSIEPDGATTLAIRFDKEFDGNMASFQGPSSDYIAFDFPNYTVGDLARNIGIAQGLVKGVRFVETGKRLRAIIQIEKGTQYKAFVQQGVLIVRLAQNSEPALEAKPVVIPPAANILLPATSKAPLVSMPSSGAREQPDITKVPQAIPARNITAGPSVVQPIVSLAPRVAGVGASLRDIEYKKTGNDSGQLVLDVSDPGVKVKVYREAMNLIIELPNTGLPRNLAKRMRVDNMDTPVTAITPSVPKDGFTKLSIETRGGWDYTFAQNNNSITVDVFKIGDDYKIGGKKVFNGKKLSLSFQQIEVRTVLQIIAEFTGLNIIASDTVKGEITLRLNEVPWDQALDIILSSRNLDMRRNGQVAWIAPRQELAERDKQEMSDRKSLEGLEPMLTETFQLNYQKAEELKKVIPSSTGGTSKVDIRTNQIFVTDTATNLDEIRRVIKQVDIPVRQVTIEAKIVEVTDSFAKNIGVKFGFDGLSMNLNGQGTLAIGSTLAGNQGLFNGSGTSTSPSINVNLPGGGINGASPGSFAFTLFDSSLTKFLNLEVNALEADGKAKTISSPRVVTSDGVEAVIEQGTEIPYLQASSSGAANVSFKKATMSLKVTPQITPDGRVTLNLAVNKDTVGQITSAGPSIDTKQVRTSVLVENGGTIVIGGIFTIDESNVVNKVPLLGDLPLVGNAFRNNSKSTTKREMVIMITPRVIDSGSVQ